MIRNFPVPLPIRAARKEAVRTEIQNRLSALGAKGIYKQLRLKAVMAFADGTFELSYMFLFGLALRYRADRLSDAAWQSLSGLLGRLQSAPVCQPVLYRSFFVLLCKGGFPKERTAGGSSDRSAVCLRSDAVFNALGSTPALYDQLFFISDHACHMGLLPGSGQKEIIC